jgi:hypothetical protein
MEILLQTRLRSLVATEMTCICRDSMISWNLDTLGLKKDYVDILQRYLIYTY